MRSSVRRRRVFENQTDRQTDRQTGKERGTDRNIQAEAPGGRSALSWPERRAGPRSATAGMKIEFAPLNVPLQRRLQTAATLQWVFSFLALAQCCLAAFVLLALSDWWMVALLYAGWLWLDWDTPSSGGRRSQWVRSWRVWDYFRDYFPITVRCLIVDLSVYLSVSLEGCPGLSVIVDLSVYLSVSQVCRCAGCGRVWELLYGGDGVFSSVSWTEVSPVDAAVLVQSPALQRLHHVWRPVCLYLSDLSVDLSVCGLSVDLSVCGPVCLSQVRNRKGFIKLALKHGAQLVPVFSFGENELFDQMQNPTGSPLRTLQNRLQSIMGVALPLFHARGVFQYSFGLMPYRKPIHTVVGKPISVTQTPSPSSEDIECLHHIYLQSLTDLFEQHKLNYGLKEDQHLTFI
ncbi:hypothetical protein L3Q82_016378 [Scortum barcoo]|uniref:Uncharacterized protein n=1 Tax=Scortum barcoo TaxID=214431 RepID=A0ACB8X970_9TELE|nr:hypothetical protein L3Q82_016378 [Scortum barcoo]